MGVENKYEGLGSRPNPKTGHKSGRQAVPHVQCQELLANRLAAVFKEISLQLGHRSTGQLRLPDIELHIDYDEGQWLVVEIRPAEQRDVEALAVLMEDLDRFYGATDVELPDQRVRQIAESLFAEPAAAYVLLAWEDEQLVGMARVHGCRACPPHGVGGLPPMTEDPAPT